MDVYTPKFLVVAAHPEKQSYFGIVRKYKMWLLYE